jgi:hypothetical protein
MFFRVGAARHRAGAARFDVFSRFIGPVLHARLSLETRSPFIIIPILASARLSIFSSRRRCRKLVDSNSPQTASISPSSFQPPLGCDEWLRTWRATACETPL